MPRKKKALILTHPVKEGVKQFKVRLDARTIITLTSKKALEFWKQRYPKAVVVAWPWPGRPGTESVQGKNVRKEPGWASPSA